MPGANSDSILTSTKAALGLAEDYTFFDPDVILHINSALSELTQLGIGPEAGALVTDASQTWDLVLGAELRYNLVKSWLWLKVKMQFDPPGTGYLVTAYEKMIEEYAWRINRIREDIDNPMVLPVVPVEPTFDDIFGDEVIL